MCHIILLNQRKCTETAIISSKIWFLEEPGVIKYVKLFANCFHISCLTHLWNPQEPTAKDKPGSSHASGVPKQSNYLPVHHHMLLIANRMRVKPAKTWVIALKEEAYSQLYEASAQIYINTKCVLLIKVIHNIIDFA